MDRGLQKSSKTEWIFMDFRYLPFDLYLWVYIAEARMAYYK